MRLSPWIIFPMNLSTCLMGIWWNTHQTCWYIFFLSKKKIKIYQYNIIYQSRPRRGDAPDWMTFHLGDLRTLKSIRLANRINNPIRTPPSGLSAALPVFQSHTNKASDVQKLAEVAKATGQFTLVREPLGQGRGVRLQGHSRPIGAPPQAVSSNRQGLEHPTPLRGRNGQKEGSLGRKPPEATWPPGWTNPQANHQQKACRAEMAATHTLSVEAERPLSSNDCRNLSTTGKEQCSGSTCWLPHQAQNSVHLLAYRHLVEGTRAAAMIWTIARSHSITNESGPSGARRATEGALGQGAKDSFPTATGDPFSMGGSTAHRRGGDVGEETIPSRAKREQPVTTMGFSLHFPGRGFCQQSMSALDCASVSACLRCPMPRHSGHLSELSSGFRRASQEAQVENIAAAVEHSRARALKCNTTRINRVAIGRELPATADSVAKSTSKDVSCSYRAGTPSYSRPGSWGSSKGESCRHRAGTPSYSRPGRQSNSDNAAGRGNPPTNISKRALQA